MRVLRFLRPARSEAATAGVLAPSQPVGLDAFATEAAPPALAAEPVNVERFVLAVIVLAAVALLEAIPTFLWLRSQFAPPVVAVAAAPAPPVAAPPEAVASAPCAPIPAEANSAAPVASPPAEASSAPARPAAAGLLAGMVNVGAPVPMHVYAGGRLVGTTESGSILLPVGTHEVEFVSEAIGFRTRRSVVVQPGRTNAVQIEAPRVPVHINAVPWAEVWVDNQRIGETPIGNLQQTIGSHEILFRHPELGERRMVVVITMKEPARISMDMRRR